MFSWGPIYQIMCGVHFHKSNGFVCQVTSYYNQSQVQPLVTHKPVIQETSVSRKERFLNQKSQQSGEKANSFPNTKLEDSAQAWQFFKFNFLIEVYSWFPVLCQSLLYSRVTRLYTYMHSSLKYILFHYGLWQDIVYSSLWYIGPCCS